MKIKVFKFTGSKTLYKGDKHYKVATETEEIENVVNRFIEQFVNELIDIRINSYECRYHNNGGYNEVDIVYTIIYK